MSKKTNETINLYYLNKVQNQNETIEDIIKRKKTKEIKEREKRIEQRKKQETDTIFDFDTETVIGMTNKNKIKQEEQKRQEFMKQQRKRNKVIKKIKNIIKSLILLGIIVGGIIFATCSPIFNIQTIEVINNNRVSKEKIISLSGINTNENIFRYIQAKAISNIKTDAYIEGVKIKRVIPNSVQINVIERTPEFSIPVLGEIAYINKQGYILEISQNELGLPIINGMKTPEENIVAGNRLEKDDLLILEMILKIQSVFKENELYDKITNIDINNKNNYSIYIEEEKKMIHIGDTSNLSNKMLYVKAILEKEKDVEGEIYVDGDFNNNFKAYFREKV